MNKEENKSTADQQSNQSTEVKGQDKKLIAKAEKKTESRVIQLTRPTKESELRPLHEAAENIEDSAESAESDKEDSS